MASGKASIARRQKFRSETAVKDASARSADAPPAAVQSLTAVSDRKQGSPCDRSPAATEKHVTRIAAQTSRMRSGKRLLAMLVGRSQRPLARLGANLRAVIPAKR